MTLTDLQTLASTDEGRERIRVMVAELMGYNLYEPIGYIPDDPDFGPLPPALYGWRIGRDLPEEIPQYTTSLDAMAEVEAGLTDRHERIKYQNTLAELTTVDGDECSLDSEFAHMTASALHRAMAYILTKQATKGDE